MILPSPADRPRSRWRKFAGPVAALVVLALGLFALHRISREVDFNDVVAAIHATPTLTLMLAAAATAMSYIVLTGYDWIALGHLGYRLPLRIVANGAFVSFTMSHTLGLTALTGGTVRYRFYTRAGVTPLDIVLIVALCGWTFWLGVVMVAGLGLVIDPHMAATSSHFPAGLNRWLGWLLLGSAAAYSLFAGWYRKPLRISQLVFYLPCGRDTVKQILLGALDLSFAAAALYVLLPAADLPPFPIFLTVYAVAMIIGALSHAPGGIGVFEAVVMVMLPGAAKEDVLAALFLFRLIYTIIPFGFGLLLLALTEFRAFQHRRDYPELPTEPVTLALTTSAPCLASCPPAVAAQSLAPRRQPGGDARR